MNAGADMDRQLEDLAAHLRARREHVLTAWRKAVSEDSALTSAASLPRTRFDDHVPDILDAYAQKLEEWPGSGVAAADAAARCRERHGAHRWQQGYYLRSRGRVATPALRPARRGRAV
jgi:hypothetical protein